MKHLLVAGCVVMLATAGCTADQPAAAPQTNTERPPVELPEDRDEEAVVAALRRIDFCAVLDRGAVAAGIDGYALRAPGPSACEITFSSGSRFPTRLNVDGVYPSMRLVQPSAVIGGAKAYIYDDAPCDIAFPISFSTVIQLFAIGRSCAETQALAAGVATALADPDQVAAEPRWAACDVMRSVTGDDIDGGSSPDGCYDRENGRRLAFDYPESFPDSRSRRGKVGGLDVWVSPRKSTDDPSCDVSWKPGRGELVATVSARTCDEARAMAVPVNRTLHEPPPDIAPQRPLLYGPTEPDGPFAGACAFTDRAASPEDCAPHRRLRIPDDGDLLSAAERDPDVACELALDSVREHFGDRMQAVIVELGENGSCYFVMPERLVQVGFSVSRRASDVGANAREIEIAGHSGHVECDSERVSYCGFDVTVSTDADHRHVLLLLVDAGPVTDARLGDGPEKGERVLADIVRRHFEN